MVGDGSDAVWGVMDIVPRTNFPDIRKKATIRSKAGSLLIIPREGDAYNLVRFYIELPHGTKAKEVKLEDLQHTAKNILSQYDVDFTDTIWWSAYPIGQRYADNFHKDYRVFLAGDACHTHSPKAGQGMNVSLQDGYNIGWKLASVLKGLAPASLLETYILERRKTAIDLINFDRYFSALFSSTAKTSPQEFQKGFIQAGKYTAGLTAKYEKSPIVSDMDETQELATNVVVGMRLPSAQVVRFCDSKPLQLMTVLKSDGRWRLMVFAGDITLTVNQDCLSAVSVQGGFIFHIEINHPYFHSLMKISQLGNYLTSVESPILRFTPSDGDMDSLIEPILVACGNRHEIELDQVPEAFYPITGKHKVRDLHKIFFDDESYSKSHGHLYEHLGMNPQNGSVVIVRPDQCKQGILSTTLDYRFI
jgi:phenol 2-monooxygenase (NADPH)